jgi:ADP-heptose:LPS heptosyltransferase
MAPWVRSLRCSPTSPGRKERPNGLSVISRRSPSCRRGSSAELTDFAETAGAFLNLDLVIAVDTAVAHLAGALAKPAWVMLPFSPDWRWMLDREDSPWYPTLRLYRQRAPGDWDDVIARAAADLAARVAHHAGAAPAQGSLGAVQHST